MKTIQVVIGVVLIFVVGLFLWKQPPEKFSVEKIQFDLPYNKDWENPPPKEGFKQIFQQRFTYLAKGARSFAFVSEDGQYVLKFFKFRYLHPHWALRYLPNIPPFESYREKKSKKVSLNTVLMGYKIASEIDPEGTGLLYVHLNLSDQQLPKVHVVDQSGREHSVDLNATRFVLQKKVTELSEELHILLRANDTQQAIQRIVDTFDLYRSHYNQGVYDLGTGFVRNNGVIEGRPVHFDVGKMTKDERILNPDFQRVVMHRLVQNLGYWLKKNYPEHQDEILSTLQTSGLP